MPQDPQIPLQGPSGTVLGVLYVDGNDNVVLHNSKAGSDIVVAKADGTALLDAAATISGNATLQGQATISGATTINNTLDVANTLNANGGISAGSAVDMSGNYLDNKSGHLSGYLSTSQSNVEDGKYINVFENIEVNDGPYTKDSASQITVNRDGVYKFSWSVGYNQDSGGSRSCLESYPEVSGTARPEYRGICYIRHANTGRRSSADGECTLSLTSGDALRVYTRLSVGNNNAHSAIVAHANVEYLG